ncbi:LOW QUALITY PROTEIN: ribonuclease P protein subunit p25b [Danio aesculapii]|uniref:LOW QUALITY PROTEIN: ribonuclease P protein subunit p25b n=1 Tax=Danio aesculapii TaxID=1142201 RepID=UPI0024C0B12E|nr:LOW QUALITY PROTEIN: ribonuclease P protein subunit p25b [Danio aesculapii]
MELSSSANLQLNNSAGFKRVCRLEDELCCPFPNLPAGVLEMRVKEGSKIRNLMGFSMARMQDGAALRQVVFSGSGRAVTKTITCAEIMKRKMPGLHQISKLQYRGLREVWESQDRGDAQMTVHRTLPSISILLSKDPLDPLEPGYQPPEDHQDLPLKQDPLEPGYQSLNDTKDLLEHGYQPLKGPKHLLDPRLQVIKDPENLLEPKKTGSAGARVPGIKDTNDLLEPGYQLIKGPKYLLEHRYQPLKDSKDSLEPRFQVLKDPKNLLEPRFQPLKDSKGLLVPGYQQLKDPKDLLEPKFQIIKDPKDQLEHRYQLIKDPKDLLVPGYQPLKDPKDPLEPRYQLIKDPKHLLEPGYQRPQMVEKKRSGEPSADCLLEPQVKRVCV